ncbi:MAG: hypothetical protein PWQ16_797 [bacterium]|nr:hypothetical protein [bacterium]
MNYFENLLKMLCGDRYSSYFFKYLNRSFSQEGEDMILRRIFGDKRNGFYVDVGAHHPFRFSNTFYFYEIGWRGINIDATPGSMELFNRFRKRDVNLELAVGNRREKRKYFIFNEPALNTFDERLAREREREGNFKVVDVIEVDTLPLADILDKYLPQGIKIDFMNVDVEGMDLEVLQSNNWDRYRPYVVLAEITPASFVKEALESSICLFMEAMGYRFFAKTFNTCFFIDVANSSLVGERQIR